MKFFFNKMKEGWYGKERERICKICKIKRRCGKHNILRRENKKIKQCKRQKSQKGRQYKGETKYFIHNLKKYLIDSPKDAT